MNEREFSTPEAARIVDISVRRMISLTELGYSRPSVQDADGHGSKRIWSYDDLIWVAMIELLSGLFTTGKLRYFAQMVEAGRKMLEKDVIWKIWYGSGGELIVHGSRGKKGPYWEMKKVEINDRVVFGETTVTSEPISDVSAPVYMTVDLGKIHTLVEERIKTLGI